MTDRRDQPSSPFAGARAALERRFGVDPRALAAFRVALAAVLLLDLALRARDLTAFYTDAGVLPRAALARLYPAYGAVSVHALSGEAWFQAALFLTAAAFALSLLAGYRTRLATLASLALLVSLHARNPMALNAGDVLLRRLLFWSLFLPLGARWAVDARPDSRARIAGVTSAALLVQVVLVYVTNVAFKLRTDVWLRGDAIRYVFELDQFTVGLAPVLAQYPTLLQVAAKGWFAMLCAAPLLLVFTGRARTLLASLFAAGHLGMAATMDLGIFPLVSLTALIPFLPPAVWDRLDDRFGPAMNRLEGLSPPGPRWEVNPLAGPRTRTVTSGVVAVLLAAMLLLNGLAVGVVDRPAAVPDAAADRSWNMFGNPPRAETWYVAHATLDSGRTVSGHISADQWGGPPDGSDRYPRARWRKFQTKLASSGDEGILAALAGDVCRRWSAESDDGVRSVAIERVREESNLRGADTTESAVVARRDC